MAVVAGRNRVNRPYFFTDIDGERVEFPSFGAGSGELDGNDLRMFNMYVAAKQITTDVAPYAFAVDGWSVAPDEGKAVVTIADLPEDNGFELTGIAIRVVGGDVTIVDAETGAYDIELEAGEYVIDIAAVSVAGQSDWSDQKAVEIAAEAPDAFVAGNWSVTATETGATVTISALPDDNGINITGIAIRVDEDEVTIVDPELGNYPIVLASGTYDIDIAAISGAGQSAWSDVKSVEVAA